MKNNTLSSSDLDKIVGPYKHPSVGKSLFQLFYMAVIFSTTCYFMYLTVSNHYGITLILSVFAGFLLVKIFIIQHDCGHGSFFKSKRANDILGRILTVFTLTPYAQWAKEHNMHHATAGNLSNRGIGDVTTWTVQEYLNSNKWQRAVYRFYRNPFFLLSIGALLHFAVKQRFPFYKGNRMSSWMSTMSTNIYMAFVIGALVFWIGAIPFVKIYLPIIIVSSTVGTWIFYIQHQFEEAYWERQDKWSHSDAAMKGSLHYDIPQFLHWLTGNIGYHHIHHLSSKIPNYNLAKCYNENPALQTASSMTLWESRKSLSIALWDEKNKKMVGFK